MTIEFVRLRDAAEEGPWKKEHLYRVLTDPAYDYFDPRPKLVRCGKNTTALIRSEWEDFKQRLIDMDHRPPKKTALMESRRKAKQRAR